MGFPEIVDFQGWYTARKQLLEREKELTRELDELSAARRALPMVAVESDYRFTGPRGEAGLGDLFGEHRQLIVQHFMYDPSWETGCGSCSAMASTAATPAVIDQLAGRGTAFVAVSRAPLPKLQAYAASQGWTFAWYSSYDSSFNLDLGVTLGPDLAALNFNFRDSDELAAAGMEWVTSYRGEQPGISCFLKVDDQIYRTYSTYGRGVEVMMPAYRLLDLTPLGRQEQWELPAGRAPVTYRMDDRVLSMQTTDEIDGAEQ